MGRLSRAERKQLLRIARDAIRAAVVHGREPAPDLPVDGPLAEPGGAFVTLHIGTRLRGCIGTFAPRGSLAATVAEMAVAAALHDTRFRPLDASEEPRIDIEISALSPLRPVAEPGDVRVGEHGVSIVCGLRRGVLLPQVAERYGWDRERFLEETCRKAGLPPEAWRWPDTRIEVFSAEVFGELDIDAEPRA